METINLAEIAIKHMMSVQITDGVIAAMMEACERTIDLCANSAITTKTHYKMYEEPHVNKQSILNTKNKIV